LLFIRGNVHIQRDSPCVDAGDDSLVETGMADIDCHQGYEVHVDIGVDDQMVTIWPTTTKVIRVSETGDDGNDGSTWDRAMKTVQAGIDALTAVEVAKSGLQRDIYRMYYIAALCIYVWRIFRIEDTREERNWNENPTILDGGANGRVITATILVTFAL